MMGMERERIGELLVAGGWLTRAALEEALQEQARSGGRIGELLVERGVLAEQTLVENLARQTGIPVATLHQGSEDPEALSSLPYAVAKRYRALPLRKEPRALHVAMADPADTDAVQALQFATGMRILPYYGSHREIDISIEQHYGMEEAVEKIVRNVEAEANLGGPAAVSLLQAGTGDAPGAAGAEGGEEGRSMAPIVRLVNLILLEAVRKEASDIHFEPTRRGLDVRFRLDGMLRRRMSIPRYLQQSILSRIKVVARMDIANKRSPQDGGIRLQLEGRRLDLRVSSLPTFYGEKVVIRLLDQTEKKTGLASLGLSDRERQRLEACYRKPQGMILVTGPTGSGKSTSLQCILRDLRSEDINIITVEDPVEYELEGVNQVQVQKEAGLSFANCLRAILRQDPNVIMVGEIRDRETAEIAFRAALTGQLVLSTPHTNDTVSTPARLVAMGVPRFLIGSALLAVVSQRLVRKNCTACRKTDAPAPEETRCLPEPLRAGLTSVARGEGCSQCEHSGFKGRIGVFELLTLSPGLREAIGAGATEEDLRRMARRVGMRPILEDALEKVQRGVTPLTEVLSAVSWDESSSPDQAVDGGGASRDPAVRLAGDAAERPGPPCIVLSEDDPGVREAVRLTLEVLNCEVIPTVDGEEGWETIQRVLPDLVITDVEMPRLDGFGLLRKVRSDLRTAFTPVILLTGRTGCEDRMKGFLLGGDDYIEKPFDHRELLARVKRTLERQGHLRAGEKPVVC